MSEQLQNRTLRMNCVLCDHQSETPEDHEQHMEAAHEL